MNDNRRKLYDALSQDYDLGTFEQFERDINDAGKRKKLYDATISEYDYGDFSAFESQLGFTPTAPRAPKAEDVNPTNRGGDNGFTFTAEELGMEEQKKNRIRQKWEARKNDDEEDEDEGGAITNTLTPEQIDEVAKKVQEKVGVTPGAQVNAPSNLESRRITVDEKAPTYKEVQAALPAANRKLSEQMQKGMTTAGAFDKSYQRKKNIVILEDEKKRLEGERDKVREQAAELRGSIVTNAGAFQFGMAPVTGNAVAETANLEMAKLGATENQLNQAIREVDRKLSGEDVGFWQGFADATVRNPGFYTFGLTDMRDARALLDISENGVNTETDKALLDATYTNSVLQSEADRGFMYRAGNQLGHSLPFMIQMAVTGGGSGISNLGTKAAQRYSTQAIKHRISRSMGVLADDLLESAFIVNTAGAGSTQTKILQNKTGQLKKDNEGNYYFDNKDGWLEAAYKGEMSAILEMYTEKLGNHLDGKLSITKGLENIGASRLSKALVYAQKSDIGKAANTIFSQFGINGVLSEVMEEEANIILNSMFVGENKFSNLFDLQTQIDIIGGMFLSIGTMRAIPGTIGSVGYMYNQGQLKRADKAAETVFGDRWPEMREALNNALNEDVAGVVDSMIDEDNANVLLNYYKRMMIMRGYNIGTTKREESIPSAEVAYQEGYEVADEQKGAVKQAYDMERERALSTFGEEAVQRLDDDPINTLAAMNDVDRVEALEYVNAKTRYEGMIDNINDGIDERIDESEKEIESHKNRQDGAIHPATMRGVNGAAPKRVYIVNGNVATFEDGTVDKANSSSMIIVRNAETGEVTTASADDFESVDGVIDTATEKQAVADAIVNSVAQEQADIIESGIQAENSTPQPSAAPLAQVSTESEVTPASGDDVSPVGMQGESGEVKTENSVVPKSALEQIPRSEKGVPLYEQVDSELAWDGVVEEAAGNEDVAMVAVGSMVEDKKKALAAAEKAKAKAGATITEKIAAENERIANIERAKADLAKWEEIAGVKAKREAQAAEMAKVEAENAQPVATATENSTATVVEGQKTEKGEKAETELTNNETTLSPASDQVVDHYSLKGDNAMLKDMEAVRKSNREEYGKISPAYELFYKAKERGLYPNELEELRAIVKGTSLEGKVDGWFTPVMAEGGNAPGQSGVEENEEVGPFGRIYRQFKGKAKEAIQFLLGKKEGEAVGALSHPEIGDIDLVWGEEGTSNSDGYGLAKLAKYHPEVLDNLQEIINDMRVTKRSANRVQLESDTHQAAVRLTWDNKSKNWLLTAFEKKNSVSDNTTDTGETSNGGKQNDTATPQNTVSTDEGTTQSANEQENSVKSEETAENESEKMYSPEELAEVKEQLGELNATSAPEFAARLFSIKPWKTLEEANAALKELLASYGETLNGQSLAVMPFLDKAQGLISEYNKFQESRSVEEVLENGDKLITNYNSRGEVATVATERDGKIVSVDSYDEGVLFEHTEYDENGKAASVTRYDKNGNAIGTQKYVDGKAKASHPVADKVLERANEKQEVKDAIEPFAKEKAAEQAPIKIEDVGEKIGGARKDALKVLASSFENATKKSLIELPFSKAFKKPDLKKAVESGALREEDALFYEAMFNALINSSKPKNSARHRNAIETWAEDTYKSLQMIKGFIEADEAARDRAMAEALEDKFPTREEELAVIEKRKVWNARNNAEWGDKTTPNPVWVAHEVLKALGYKPGDKVEIPFGVLKANVFATGYEFYNKKGERLIMQSVPTVEEGIEKIVWLSKIKRGDADTMHPVSSFFATPTKRDMGDSGRYYVLWGTVRNPRRSEFDSIEEANAFAANHKEAVVRPIQEVVKRYGYKLVFREPLTGDKFYVNDMEFETEGEAMQYLEENYDAVNEQTNEHLAKERGEAKKEVTADDLLEVAMVRGKEGWKYAVNIKGKYANNMGMPLLLREFDTREDAKAFMNESKNDVFEVIKKQQAEQKKFVFFDTGENSRIGEDYRGGRDVTAQDFMDSFGFRGVQFGNWTNQEDRQMAVNQAYDAFMDLAKLLGVSPKALSLNGELGMAFGSRGSGFGNAHYEPGEIVINLTKTRGAGSLAHEWWHALDNYFARRANVPMGMVTDSRSIDMRPELREAYNELLKMIEKSDFYLRSKAKGDYWGRMHEVTARLMAEWVDQSLKDKGELNTFLSRGVNEDKYKRMNYDVHRAVSLIKGKEPMSYEEFAKTPEALAGFPYPSRAELKEFGDAMRNIFETVEEQETEEGDVVLYRSAEDNNARTISYDEAVQIADDFVRTHKGSAKKIVISRGNDSVEQQMRDAGFSEVSIEAFKKDYANRELPTAAYFPDSDGIVIFKISDKDSLMDSLWHENSHRVLDKYIKNPGLLKIRFDELPARYKDMTIKLIEGNYEEHQYPEEAMCMFIGGLYKHIPNFKNGQYDITNEFITFEKEYRRFVDFAQHIINEIYYGRETGFDGDGSSGANERQGEWDSTHQRDARGEGNGGTNKEEAEVVDRQGNGPLTDREVVMESDARSKELGKPRYYGKRQREYVARQRRRMADKARQVAEKLNLDNVEVLESTEGLMGKKATSKGWFDPKTGKITVVVPNHGSTGDIVETVLHEAVAHYGLRRLFGKNFDTFLDNVYNNVTPEIRAEIAEMAKQHGWDFHTATEEYLASLAENTNFEKVNPSLWSNIKSFFMKMLAKVGITLDEPLTDNELRYILWRSHQNLVNPGWFNVFGQAEDIAKQYELGVGNYQTESGKVKAESNTPQSQSDSSPNLVEHLNGEVAAENGLRFREGEVIPVTVSEVTARERYERRVDGRAAAWKEAWLDAIRSVKAAQEAIEDVLGTTIGDMSNVYDYMNTIPSINKNKMEVFEGKHQNPFLQLLSRLMGLKTKKGVELDEKTLERYANTKHGLERGREIAVKNALTTRENGKTVFNSKAYDDWRAKRREILANGKSWREQQAELDALARAYGAKLTDAAGLTAIFDPEKKMNYSQIVNEAMKFIEDIEGVLKENNALTPFWKAIKGINEYTLHEYYVGGLISKKQYDDLQDMYEYYVPLRGFDETTSDEKYDYVSERRSVLNSPIKNASGRESEAAHIFATMLNLANSAIVYSSKNKVKQRLLNLAMQYKTPLLSVDNAWYVKSGNDWEPKYPDIHERMTEEQILEAYQKHEAEMRELEKAGMAKRYEEGLDINYKVAEPWQKNQHAVSVKRNGREYIVYVNGSPKLAQAINGLLLKESHGWLLNASDKINHMRAKLVTGWSPSFVARNLARDTQGSSVYYFAKYGFGAMRKFQKNIRRVLPQIHGFYNLYKKGTLDEKNKMHQYFKEFLENGGETGYTEMISIKDYEKKIKKMLKENSVLSMAKGLPEDIAGLVEFANRGVENTCRFAAYVTSREAGVSVLQSIKDAKDVSVNFNRKGSGAKGNSEARKLYMFLNPAIQAAVQRIELTKKYPKRMAMVYATEFALGAALPMLFSLLYSLLGGDDDEAEGNYYNLTNFIRRSNICLPFGDGVLTIPIAHESRVFFGLGEIVASYINGHTEYDNIGLDLVNTFAQVLPLNPVEGWAPGESVEAILANFAPDPVKPLVEIYVNSNFAGAKIHNATDFTEHLPSQYRGLRNTGIFYQKASSMISGEYEKNWADKALSSFITPSSLEHLAQSYLGGLYTFVDETVKTAQWIGGSEEFADFRNIPVINSFYKSLEKYEAEPGERTRRDWEKAFQHYYDAVEADADSEKTMNTRVKAKDAGAEVALTEAMERGDLLRIDIFNDGYDVIKDLYTEMDAAKQAKNFDLVDEIDKKIYAQKRFIVERMEQLADDPLCGYDMLTMKDDTSYGRMETYADVRDAKVISDFKKVLKPIYDGEKTAEDYESYFEQYKKELYLYEDLNDFTRDIGKGKSYEDLNEDDMRYIRQLRAEAIGLIDEYLKNAAKVNL